MSSFDPDILKTVRIQGVDACPLCASAERTGFERDQNEDPIHAVLCGGCGLMYMDGIVASEDLPKLYGGYHARVDEEEPELAAKRVVMYELDAAYAKRFIKDGSVVLDIGCGEGNFLEYFPQMRRYGVEVDRQALEVGRDKLPEISFFESIEALPSELRFDAILFRGTIQYMPDLERISAFCNERLVSGGRIIVLATPNLDSLLAQLQREHWVFFDKIEHRHTFGISQLKRLFGDDFAMEEYDLPYLGTPYERYEEDYKKVVAMYDDPEARKRRVPFIGSMLRMVLRKN